ncbi:MAG: sugar transport system permease protein [Frankiaceae bacterium]|jgi:simple sugar transport system permease protein|nr:sugar transport system permease protein [Frankiaceae bacterium]
MTVQLPANAAPASRVRERSPGELVRGKANEIGLLVVVAVLFFVLSSTAQNFGSVANVTNILRDAAFTGIVAWGMTLVIISGEIDISVGSNAAFSSILLAKLTTAGWALPLAIVATLVVGMVFGLAAGMLRAYLGIPTFVSTLALYIALRGLANVLSQAVPIPIESQSFQQLGIGSVFGIPTPAIIMFVLFVVFSFVARRTVFGRSVFAVGGNADAARLSGTNVAGVRIALLGITGCLAALTGILIASRLGSGNSGAASGLEFEAIAAVVVGGTSLAGGRGNMLGTLLGVLFIAELVNGLVLLGVSPFMQDVVRGAVVLGAVVVNALIVRRQLNRSARRGAAASAP